MFAGSGASSDRPEVSSKGTSDSCRTTARCRRSWGCAGAVETLDTYADLWPDQLDEVADKVDEARRAALQGHEHRDEDTDDGLAGALAA